MIGELLRNASVSTLMLSIYINLLEKRGRGQKDQQILKEAQKVLQEKKQRIIKASELLKSRKKLLEPDFQFSLIQKLADNDKVIRKAVHNILVDLDPAILIDLVTITTKKVVGHKILQQFIILSEMLELIGKRDDLRHLTVSSLTINRPLDPEFQNNTLTEYFVEIIHYS